MKKSFKVRDLNCANCAAKIESAIAKLDGVLSVRVNFLSQRMTLEAPDDVFDMTLAAAGKAARRVESGFTILT